MEVVSYDSLVDMRASRGIVKDYKPGLPSHHGVQPPNDYGVLFNLVERDELLWTAVDLTVDMVTHNGIDFLRRRNASKDIKGGKGDSLIEVARKRFDDELDYDSVQRNILWQLLVYGDAFMYLEVKGGKVVKLHPLETSEMVINHDEHGEVSGYTQKPNHTSNMKSWVHFGKDEIIYYRMYWVGSQVYSYTPFRSIAKVYNAKLFATDYVQHIFQNLPPKMVYFLKNASKDQRDAFVQMLIRNKMNPARDVVGTSNDSMNAQMLNYVFDSGLPAVLDMIQRRVISVLRVPPHWLGMVEGANRGIGENVVIPFETRVKRIQGIIASVNNKELMPKLGLSTLEFRFNAISLMDEKVILANAQTLKGLQLESETEDPVIRYLRDHGISLPPDTKVIDPMEGVEGVPGGRPKDAFPSRARKDKADKMEGGLDKKGVSEAGKAKLEKKQEVMA